VLLVHDNNGYGEIKASMIAHNVPPLGVDILTPDLGAIAAACGWAVARPGNIDDLPRMLRAAVAAKGPTMILFGDSLRDNARNAAGA
jgi:acetolactate synthase-1/2/3 large subunit